MARAIRLIADRHWHLGNKFKGSKDENVALKETVYHVCAEGHESQFHWTCTCNHKALVAIRDSAYSKMDELLQAATTPQQAIGWTVLTMARADDGHRVCVGDWSAANLRRARVALPYTSLQLVQPRLIRMVQDYGTHGALYLPECRSRAADHDYAVNASLL